MKGPQGCAQRSRDLKQQKKTANASFSSNQNHQNHILPIPTETTSVQLKEVLMCRIIGDLPLKETVSAAQLSSFHDANILQHTNTHAKSVFQEEIGALQLEVAMCHINYTGR